MQRSRWSRRGVLLASLALAGSGRHTLGQDATPATVADGDVPFARGNATRTGEIPGPGPSGQPVLRWSFQTGEAMTRYPDYASPVVVDGIVYTGSPRGGHYFAVDARTGQERWRYPVEFSLGYPAAVANGLVVIGNGNSDSDESALIALDVVTGQERWRLDLVFNLTGAPLIVGETVYCAENLHLTAVDAGGELLWRVRPAEGRVETDPAFADGSIYVAGSGSVCAFEAATGQIRWEFPLEGFGASSDAVAVQGGMVYAAGWENSAPYALDTATGTVVWQTTLGAGAMTPAVTSDTVYVSPGATASLAALDRLTGAPRWQIATEGKVHSSPVVAGDRVYFGSLAAAGTGAILYAVNTVDGAVHWTFPIGGDIQGSPAVVDGMIYVDAYDGVLYAIGD